MLDTDTFLTILYVMADDFCKTNQARLPRDLRPGPRPSLCRSEVLTLAIFSQWRHFASELQFHQWAQRHLAGPGGAFPRLPHRSQFNRLLRHHYESIVAFWQYLTDLTRQLPSASTSGNAVNDNHEALDNYEYEALDATAVPVRYVHRRGHSWLAGQATVGRSSRLGWYCGFYLLAATDPHGVITGWGFGSANTKDQPLATAFLRARFETDPQLPTVGHAVAASPALAEGGFYLTDSGFQGQELHQVWREQFGAEVLTPPQRPRGKTRGGKEKDSKEKEWPWDRGLRHWIASLRQIIETAFAKLHHVFRLRDERPHTLDGFMARLAAKITLHNFCIYMNRQLRRPDLAFADLWAW